MNTKTNEAGKMMKTLAEVARFVAAVLIGYLIVLVARHFGFASWPVYIIEGAAVTAALGTRGFWYTVFNVRS